jgi:hypothetical protein
MENNTDLIPEKQESLTLSENALSFLSETSKWGKFISIAIFCFLFMLEILGLVMIIFGYNISSKINTTGIGILYMLIGIVYIFPTLYLYHFSDYLNKSLKNNDSQKLETAFEKLKSYFKFTGILFIILIAFYVLVLFGLLIAFLVKCL